MDLEQSLLRRPKRLKLQKALKLSYVTSDAKRAKALKRYGYVLDKELSTPERLVAYSPFKKDILYVPRGTELKSGGHIFDNPDLKTDIILGTGGLKQTQRYKDEENTLLKARQKYKEDKVVFVGHSLGGGLVNALPSRSQDKVITYNAPILKAKRNAVHYRTEGDIFSFLNKEAVTLPNTNPTGPVPFLGRYILDAHTVDNLKNQPIFV